MRAALVENVTTGKTSPSLNTLVKISELLDLYVKDSIGSNKA